MAFAPGLAGLSFSARSAGAIGSQSSPAGMALANDSQSITTMTDRLRSNTRLRFIVPHPSVGAGFFAAAFHSDKLRHGLQFPSNKLLVKLQSTRAPVNSPLGFHAAEVTACILHHKK